jgi:thiol:disulfide interchange protein
LLDMLAMMALALVGGLILNVMPCVLPVLALKAFHVVDHARHDARKRRMHGLAYTLGTMSLFMALATLSVVAKQVLGKTLHWGMQFQNPHFVAAITALVFAFGLNALGVFEIALSMSGEGGDDEKFSGSYVNGLFAAIMATPCSAPFLGTAVAFALGSSATWWQTELIFALIGLGLALPYLALTLVPSLAKFLPKPGPWMETVKQLMGFALMGTAVWLFRTLQKQVTPESSNGFLLFLVFLGLALWAGGRWGGVAAPTLRRWAIRGVQVAGLAAVGFVVLQFAKPLPLACADECTSGGTVKNAEGKAVLEPVVVDGHIKWTPFNAKRIETEHKRNRPVFLDFTAEWCATCKANDKAFIETDTVRKALERTGVLPMQVDMTNDHPEGDKLMDKLGRNGIPIYVIMFPDGSYDLLPEAITAELVATRLDAAAQKYPVDKFAL